MSSNIELKKKCDYCGKEYVAKTVITRYCSHNCNRKHYKQVKRDEKLTNAVNASKDIKTGVVKKINDKSSEVIIKQFLSIDEAAVLIGASSRTIKRLIQKGTLKASKVSRRTIICRKDIDKLFQ